MASPTRFVRSSSSRSSSSSFEMEYKEVEEQEEREGEENSNPSWHRSSIDSSCSSSFTSSWTSSFWTTSETSGNTITSSSNSVRSSSSRTEEKEEEDTWKSREKLWEREEGAWKPLFASPHYAPLLLRSFFTPPVASAAVSSSRLLRVLVVGAGGIGCELLHLLSISPLFASPHTTSITVLDMDRIAWSNLNRQFLFQPEDVGKWKSEVAAAYVNRQCFSDVHERGEQEEKMPRGPPTRGGGVTAVVGRLEDQPLAFYRSFDLFFLAVDSIDSRRYLNGVIGARLATWGPGKRIRRVRLQKKKKTTENKTSLEAHEEETAVSTIMDVEEDVWCIQRAPPIVDCGSEGFQGHCRVIQMAEDDVSMVEEEEEEKEGRKRVSAHASSTTSMRNSSFPSLSPLEEEEEKKRSTNIGNPSPPLRGEALFYGTDAPSSLWRLPSHRTPCIECSLFLFPEMAGWDTTGKDPKKREEATRGAASEVHHLVPNLVENNGSALHSAAAAAMTPTPSSFFTPASFTPTTVPHCTLQDIPRCPEHCVLYAREYLWEKEQQRKREERQERKRQKEKKVEKETKSIFRTCSPHLTKEVVEENDELNGSSTTSSSSSLSAFDLDNPRHVSFVAKAARARQVEFHLYDEDEEKEESDVTNERRSVEDRCSNTATTKRNAASIPISTTSIISSSSSSVPPFPAIPLEEPSPLSIETPAPPHDPTSCPKSTLPSSSSICWVPVKTRPQRFPLITASFVRRTLEHVVPSVSFVNGFIAAQAVTEAIKLLSGMAPLMQNYSYFNGDVVSGAGVVGVITYLAPSSSPPPHGNEKEVESKEEVLVMEEEVRTVVGSSRRSTTHHTGDEVVVEPHRPYPAISSSSSSFSVPAGDFEDTEEEDSFCSSSFSSFSSSSSSSSIVSSSEPCPVCGPLPLLRDVSLSIPLHALALAVHRRCTRRAHHVIPQKEKKTSKSKKKKKKKAVIRTKKLSEDPDENGNGREETEGGNTTSNMSALELPHAFHSSSCPALHSSSSFSKRFPFPLCALSVRLPPLLEEEDVQGGKDGKKRNAPRQRIPSDIETSWGSNQHDVAVLYLPPPYEEEDASTPTTSSRSSGNRWTSGLSSFDLCSTTDQGRSSFSSSLPPPSPTTTLGAALYQLCFPASFSSPFGVESSAFLQKAQIYREWVQGERPLFVEWRRWKTKPRSRTPSPEAEADEVQRSMPPSRPPLFSERPHAPEGDGQRDGKARKEMVVVEEGPVHRVAILVSP